MSLAGRLEYWATATPDRSAIIDGPVTLTWHDWNAAADAVATALSQRGVTDRDVVAVRTRTRGEWAVIDAALAKLGCPAVALNWQLTPTEAAHVLSDSAASVVVCDDEDPSRLATAWSGRVVKAAICFGAAPPGFSSYEALLEEPASRWISAEDAPLIVYTSGTTGRPKGVYFGRPRATAGTDLRRYLDDLAQADDEGPDDVVLMALPLSHGLGAGSIRRSARVGSTLVIMRRFEPEEALRLIECHRITRFTAVPTMLLRLAALPADVLARYDLRSLRLLGIGGSPVPHWLKLWALETFGPCVYEGYGSTETSLVSVLRPSEIRAKPQSCGRLYAGVELSVRSPEGHALGAGELGEIWVRTPVTATGYLDRSAIEDFDADGFFRTGDRGHLDHDGFLFLTGRSKDMIITGGVNVYPAEIESVLRTHPGIEDVAVIGTPHDDYGEQVVAVCQIRSSHRVDERELLAHCRSRLAGFKVPKVIQLRTELPRNALGKVVKHRLRAPYWADEERVI
ncbi:class I adenylate-forming enzyme family protein [Pseudonocardia spinosispora]|uniref:class I adenylate-forming enzyme family protein n=1 Tax=Pseudonocardia spinosispora TaxID=103441 RepID=UPI000561C46E|nr:AMP-binding protein [Pseudonocardia spinosispora]